ncbi:hypothetical protein FA95DRAFT_1529052 [Auriscalpium vulgare]|uniref:Uncharacterized protein n=1 Tax=Auriscalpium vulgare TaxID=40419 RepID=A0ACB8R3G1_9AGAM|nr:hypothetical protein FA95DRAFT_1529052 [Auriscalpium vulgare]
MPSPIEQPPLFRDLFLPDDHTPAYSPQAHETERVLQTSSESAPDLPSQDPAPYAHQPESSTHYIYNNEYMHVNMGPRLWGPRQPAYGFNGIVQGTVKLTKKCSHVYRLQVSLLGNAKVSATSRGMLSDMLDKPLVSSTTTLFATTPEATFCPTEHVFTFSIPFPTFVSGELSPLPPSYMAWSPGLSVETTYTLKLDVFRKGLRRHENRHIPLLYLPKTWPSLPPPRRDIMHQGQPSEFKTIPLPPIWPSDDCPRFKARANVPTVELFIPAHTTFSSGSTIPLKMTFTCAQSPASAKLLTPSTEVRLLKRTLARVQGVSGTGVVNGGRELIVATGVLIEADNSQEGVSVAYFDLQAGETGKEQSWRINGELEVAYFIRVSIRSSGGTTNYLPTFSHDELVQISTEPWGTRDREELQGGASAPAIGMNNPRIELRPTHSVAW